MTALRIRTSSRCRLGALAGGAAMVLLATACQRSSQEPAVAQAPPPAQPAPEPAPPPQQPQKPEQAQPVPAPRAPVVVRDVGFKTPESVLHDPAQDGYFASNINGKPTDTDGNGCISKLRPDR